MQASDLRTGRNRRMYRAVTQNIEIKVAPRFLVDQSKPEEHQFFWSYTIEITNLGEETVQLISRHWKITDGMGRLHEVKGAGVIGQQPVIAPGDSFRYTSGCPLETPEGIMAGSYQMLSETGRSFNVEVPAFSLDSSTEKRLLN